VHFPKAAAAPAVAAVTPPRPQARPPKTKAGSGRKVAGGKVKPAAAVARKVVVAARKTQPPKSAKPPPKAVVPHKKIVFAAKPKPKTRTKTESKPRPAVKAAPAKQARSIAKVLQPSPAVKKAKPAGGIEKIPAKTMKTVQPSARKPVLSAPAKTPPKAAVKSPPKKPEKRLAARRPAASSMQPKVPEPTDISKDHKLSFIIKYDGMYRAMIDRHEYTAGMSIVTSHGEMIIADIRKRAVHLLQKSGNGFKTFVIRHRRRR